MNPRVRQVQPLDNFQLRLTFANGEQRIFNVSPYLKYDAFRRLGNPAYFSLAHAEHGTVVWPDIVDFCPDTLYMESVKEEPSEYSAGPSKSGEAGQVALRCGLGKDGARAKSAC